MRKIALSLFLVAVVIALAVRLGVTIQTDPELRRFAQQAAWKTLPDVTDILKSKGILAATDYCREPHATSFRDKHLWIFCDIAANFFDPKAKVVTNGGETIFPVGIYLRSENALDWVRQGYGARDIDIWVWVASEPHKRSDKIGEISTRLANL